MMRIRDDQLVTLQRAARDRTFQAIVQELRHEHPDDGDRCRDAVRRAYALLDAGEPWSTTHRLQVARWVYDHPAFPDLEGRWGRLLRNVLTNERAEPETRMRFLVEELMPRVKRGRKDS